MNIDYTSNMCLHNIEVNQTVPGQVYRSLTGNNMLMRIKTSTTDRKTGNIGFNKFTFVDLSDGQFCILDGNSVLTVPKDVKLEVTMC